jgi:hypothetical protein
MTHGVPRMGSSTPRPPLRRRAVLLGLAGVALLGALGPWMATGMTTRSGADRAPGVAAGPDTLTHAPPGVRVRVHVTNASGVRGLARRATAHLRSRGFDVVAIDSERDGAATVTQVLVHAGPADHGRRVRRALGVGGPVDVRPDSTRYVEVRVRLGRDWQASPQALRP